MVEQEKEAWLQERWQQQQSDSLKVDFHSHTTPVGEEYETSSRSGGW